MFQSTVGVSVLCSASVFSKASNSWGDSSVVILGRTFGARDFFRSSSFKMTWPSLYAILVLVLSTYIVRHGHSLPFLWRVTTKEPISLYIFYMPQWIQAARPRKTEFGEWPGAHSSHKHHSCFELGQWCEPELNRTLIFANWQANWRSTISTPWLGTRTEVLNLWLSKEPTSRHSGSCNQVQRRAGLAVPLQKAGIWLLGWHEDMKMWHDVTYILVP